MALLLKKTANFAVASLCPARHFGKIRSVMLILRFVNVGNSRISARDSIVVLTLIAWAAIVTSALMVSYDLQIKTWHSWLTFSIFN